MKEYNHSKIEKKWQTIWEKKGIFHADDKSKKPKYYSLIEFPYPSGSGLHVGHIRSNTAMDIVSRKRRMEGYNVLYPIGWDAFGLPTENYAIKTGIHPIKVTKDNTDTFRKQLKALGFSFDWSREINTTDPKYYKWTQWIFIQLFKKGLAYKTRTEINWCPSCKIGLANEEVVGGMCERCEGPTEKREKEQWMLAITKYADRLDKDLDTVDYLEKIKIQQRNWIGKSEGLIFSAKVKDSDIVIKTFTAHYEGCYADTFFVIAPDHPLLPKLLEGTKEKDSVLKKARQIVAERNKLGDDYKKVEGVFTGRHAVDPLGNGDLPIWVASFALKDYGTGIVKCSAHDERDVVFAKKYNIRLKEVIEPLFVTTSGADAVQWDKPLVEREAVSSIVKHWSEDKYLCLKWNEVDWGTFVTGGVEPGQTPEDAAKAEILEETGYFNLKLIKNLGRFHSQFYHVPKKENRFGHFTSFYFELVDGKQKEISQVEQNKHAVVWVEKKEVENFLISAGQRCEWSVLQGTQSVITEGILNEPLEFKGRNTHDVRKEITDYIVKKGFAVRETSYKLRDWVFSRQRYWGEPIPLINCGTCGFVPVPDKDLPVVLPKVTKYKPRDDGESPLADIKSWVSVKCPKCKGPAKRETDTMPNWAGSSWYFLRYTDPKNNKEFASAKNLKYWMGNGVDWYNGGMEHTTLHLLYSRFWHKFLYDLKLVPTSEPYAKRTSHGLILADDGTKFSKSKGNGIDPLSLIKIYGADTVRMYEMFMGPFDQSVSWNTDGLTGPRRFLERVWKMGAQIAQQEAISKTRGSRSVLREGRSGWKLPPAEQLSVSLERLLHQTIKKVSEDIEAMKFNTAISSLMIFMNEVEKNDFPLSTFDFQTFLKLLSPFAPHITEELWAMLGEKKSINFSDWPKWDENLIQDEEIKIVIQVNGKVRAEMMIQRDEDEASIKHRMLNTEAVLKYTSGKAPKKVIYVKNRLFNIVT